MITLLLLFVLGSCFGSFFALISYRLPLNQSLIAPSSYCGTCQHSLTFFDLIPILSYCFLKGRCRYCNDSYSKLTIVAEISTGSLLCLLYLGQLLTITFLPGILLIIMGLLLSLTDWLYLTVEPLILYPLTLSTFLAILSFDTFFSYHFVDALILVCLLLFLSLIKPGSLGYGDILLITYWTFFLGFLVINFILLLASSFALLIYFLAPSSNKKEARIPFVPYLFGALLIYLFGTYGALSFF